MALQRALQRALTITYASSSLYPRAPRDIPELVALCELYQVGCVLHKECCTKSVVPSLLYQVFCTKSVVPSLLYQVCCTKSVVPSLLYQVCCTKCVVQECCTKSVAPRVLHQVCCSTKYVVPSVLYQVCWTKCAVPRVLHQVCWTKYVAPSVLYQECRTNSVVPSVLYQVCCTKCVIPSVLYQVSTLELEVMLQNRVRCVCQLKYQDPSNKIENFCAMHIFCLCLFISLSGVKTPKYHFGPMRLSQTDAQLRESQQYPVPFNMCCPAGYGFWCRVSRASCCCTCSRTRFSIKTQF